MVGIIVSNSHFQLAEFSEIIAQPAKPKIERLQISSHLKGET
jgi:hypothetical protein